MTLNLPVSFGMGDKLPEMEFVELLGMKQMSLVSVGTSALAKTLKPLTTLG